MKKILTSMAALLGMTIALSGCNESKDDHPVLEPLPGTEQATFLNIPEMTNASIVFTKENENGYVHMTCSQPEYGFAASVSYQVEVSFDEKFTTPVVSGAPASVLLMTAFYDCAEINPQNSEIAAAVCDLLGVVDEGDVPTPAKKLYVRLNANIQQTGGEYYPNTNYVSNVVSIESVTCSYLAICVPDLPSGIFLRGSMNSWGAVDEYQFVTTKTFGEYIIKAVSIPAGNEFKVADSSWGSINLGTGGSFEIGKAYKLEDKGGNITMPADFNGCVTLTQKGSSYSVLFTQFE